MIDLSVLFSVSLENRSQLPLYGGVYIVHCKEEFLYIGQANSLRNRWSNENHQKYHLIKEMQNVKIYWIKVDDSYKRMCLERDLINFYKPKFNRDMRKKPKKVYQKRIINTCKENSLSSFDSYGLEDVIEGTDLTEEQILGVIIQGSR